jgi:hypothetical protein
MGFNSEISTTQISSWFLLQAGVFAIVHQFTHLKFAIKAGQPVQVNPQVSFKRLSLILHTKIKPW